MTKEEATKMHFKMLISILILALTAWNNVGCEVSINY